MTKRIFIKKPIINVFVGLTLLITLLLFTYKHMLAQNGEWEITGSMSNYHLVHTVTLLPNGKVLVAGGCSDISCSSITASAELYDPATGVWTSTASMQYARVEHTAILLPNGKVLIAGGHAGSSILNSVELYDPALETWTTINPMINARYSFNLILLPNGKILVAGGVGAGFNFLSSSELFDPTTGDWTATGSLDIGRVSTTILLENGDVLLAGGENDDGRLTSALLYDIDTEIWTYTGSLNEPHSYHPLFQLANGKVLFPGAPENPSCELYDPNTGTWAYTGSMNVTRRGAAFALLPDGEVLAAGGSVYGGPNMTTSAEIYDPITGSWTDINPMNVAKPGKAVLLQNGNVLVAGANSAELYYENYAPTADAGPDQFVNTMSLVTLDGNGSSDPNGDPITYLWEQTGGTPVTLSDPTAVNPSFTAPEETEVLTFTLVVTDDLGLASELDEVIITVNNQQSGEWVITGSMNNPRQWHSATLLQNGNVLVAGGHNFSSTLSSAELYNPSLGAWTITDSLDSGRYFHTAVLLSNGKVLVAGGQNDSTALASAELFDPETEIWEITGSMNTARNFSTATVLLNGKVLVVGGCSNIDCRYSDLSSAELYDPTTGTWTNTGSMNNERASHTATLLPDGKVLVTGGVEYFSTYFKTVNSVELYDPDTGTWQSVASMNSERASHTATLLPNGEVLVAGGGTIIHYYDQCNWNHSTISIAEIYDPATNTWETTSPMNHVRQAHTTNLLPNGKVMITGGSDYIDICGQNFHSFSLSAVEIYDPESGLWQDISSLNYSRTSHSATLLQGGNILVEGGFYEYLPLEGVKNAHSPQATSLSAAEYYYENYPPIADAGLDQVVNTISLVTLDGSGSSDPGGDLPLTYFWTQISGTPQELDDPTVVSPTLTAPENPDMLTFSLIVTDSLGLRSVADEVVITVNNQAPLSDAGLDQSVNTMSLVTLDGSGSRDLDGDLPLTYLWLQTSGTPVELNNPTAVNPTFTAPDDPDILTFSLVVTDNLGLASMADEVIITVNNQAPIADAGPEQTFCTLTLVILDGSDSNDLDGDLPLTFFWTQISGTPVELSNPSAVNPTFTSPSDPVTLTFSLVVTDSLGLASVADEVTIIVEGYLIFLPIVVK